MLFIAISLLLAPTRLGSKLCTDTTRLILHDTEPFISLVVLADSRASFLCRAQCTKPSVQHSSSGAVEKFRKTLSVQQTRDCLRGWRLWFLGQLNGLKFFITSSMPSSYTAELTEVMCR